ncbi:MAG: hypothetical protein ACP5E9_09455 [Candidatus Methanospirareceae archaeon]
MKDTTALLQEAKAHGRGAARRTVAVTAVVALVLVAMAGLASAELTQTWYLSSSTDDGTYIMYRDNQTGGTDEVPIAGSAVIWLAHEPAAHTITFSDGEWPITIRWVSDDASEKAIDVSVGYCDGTFHAGGTERFVLAGITSGTITGTITANPIHIEAGQYLALQLTAPSNTGTKVVTANQASALTKPETATTYPFPELATVVLFGAGLLALVGYVRYRKRS